MARRATRPARTQSGGGEEGEGLPSVDDYSWAVPGASGRESDPAGTQGPEEEHAGHTKPRRPSTATKYGVANLRTCYTYVRLDW